MHTQHAHSYAVIMAGGSGTRLWPLSRQEKPKQFQSFVSTQTLIQETFARIARIIPPKNIFVSTTQKYKKITLEQLPDMTEARLILEPESRNTAPAIALIAATIARFDTDAIVATIASDHAIENPEEFEKTITAAYATVAKHRDKLVTVGINPTHPDTSLGYIKMGKEFATIAKKRIFSVEAFKEKPDLATAERYLADWEYLWNAGYFIFTATRFAEWTKQYAPTLHHIIANIMDTKTVSPSDTETIRALSAQTPSEPIDTLIVEKLSDQERLVIPSALKWSDVGSWSNLYNFLREKDGLSIIVRGKHLDLESKNIFVYGKKKLIATIGLQDIIIVDTDDVILIAHRDKISTNIKKILEQLKKDGQETYL